VNIPTSLPLPSPATNRPAGNTLRKPKISRHCSELRPAVRVRAAVWQKLVAPRSAISTDNIDLPVRILNGCGQIVKQVEQADRNDALHLFVRVPVELADCS
jgi:hypothetical protein